VRIEFTATYTYQDALRTVSDLGGERNRQLYPEEFWQAFRFSLSGSDQSFGPGDVRSGPIYASSSPTDTTSTLRGAIVWLEFDVTSIESQLAEVEVVTLAGQSVSVRFDLGRLR